MTDAHAQTIMIQVLGPIAVRSNGAAKPVRGQQGEVLAILTAAYPAGVHADAIVEALWGESPPKTVKTGLAVVLHRLRERLGGIDRLLTEHGGYRLALAAEQIDVSCFDQLVASARTANDARDFRGAAEMLGQALELWRGDAFQPFDATETLAVASIALNERRLAAEDLLLDALLADGRDDDAAAWASKLVSAAPYREQRWHGLALALYRSSRQTEALRAIGDAVRTLRDDIGVEAGPALRQLENDILVQSRSLLLPAPTKPPSLQSDLGASESLPLRQRGASVGEPATSFLGRDDDIGSVVGLLDAHRFVTVVAPAGLGKTRLAARVARSSSIRVLWHDLAALEGDQVVERFASRLGLSAPAPDRLDRIVRDLRTEPTLVVLDNCEHVSASVAELAEAIVQGSPTTQVLATSRTTIGSPNETRFSLPALSTDAAVELLRSRAFGTGVTPNLDTDSVIRLVEKLDHNPLLIELVAEPVRTLSAEAVSQQLERVLTEVDPDSPSGRHSSLVAAIDWSVALLDPATSELHATLGVMSGGFTAEDVVAIVGGTIGTIESQLADLCSHGLLTTDGAAVPLRYRQADAVGIHARQRLQSLGTGLTVYQAHANAHVDLVDQLIPELWGADEARSVQRLRNVRGQLTATHERLVAAGDVEQAARFAMAMWEYSFLRLDIAQFGWMADVLKLDGVEDLPNYGDVLGTAAFAAWARNDFYESSRLADASVNMANAGPVSLQALRARFNVASFNEPGRGPMDAFGALFGATLEQGAPHLQSDLQVLLAIGLSQIGEKRGAERAAAEAVAIADETSNPSCIAWALYGLGWTRLDDQPLEAARSFLAAARIARTVDNRFVEAMAQGALVTSALRRGRLSQARSLLIDVISMWNRLESTPQLIRSCREAVLVLADQGDIERARVALARVELLDLGHPLTPHDQQRFDELAEQIGVPDEPIGFDPEHRLAETIVGLLQATDT